MKVRSAPRDRRQMHDGKVHTNADLVRRLLAQQFPAWARLPIEPVPSAGTDNALCRLGDAMSVRLPRVAWVVESIEREFTWLPRLAPSLPCAVPVPPCTRRVRTPRHRRADGLALRVQASFVHSITKNQGART